MYKALTSALIALGITVSSLLAATPANATPSSTHYSNCAAVHRAYSGGIARAGVHYNKVSGRNKALKGHVKFSTSLYNANKRLDRDRDGIACEKS